MSLGGKGLGIGMKGIVFELAKFLYDCGGIGE